MNATTIILPGPIPVVVFCMVCDQHQPGDGAERRTSTAGTGTATYACAECLAVEPCDACGGNHHHADACASVAATANNDDARASDLASLVAMLTSAHLGESDMVGYCGLTVGVMFDRFGFEQTRDVIGDLIHDRNNAP
jgi:hypothetical protein